MRNGEIGMILSAETYLHGNHTFFFSVDKVKKLLEKYNLPDIGLFFDCPVIIETNDEDKTVKFGDFCPCRKLGYDTNSET